jgi:uncharacterized damage-inducible protein DinB
MAHVEDAIRQWETARAGVIAEIEHSPDGLLDFRPGDGARTVRELAAHIAESGVAFANELLKPDGNFANLFDPHVQAAVRASLPHAHSKAEVVALLRTSGEQIVGRLRQVGEHLADQQILGRMGPQSRLSALWFAVSHESYHRGQLTAYERGFGVVPALTLQIAARQRRPSG